MNNARQDNPPDDDHARGRELVPAASGLLDQASCPEDFGRRRMAILIGTLRVRRGLGCPLTKGESPSSVFVAALAEIVRNSREGPGRGYL
jgi:hypothetical protein